ncbi:Crp/Fnr family transcriptional regulator [Telmatospirillum siberiense]|nr:Crp/Fnr family transcriptional regulator [Telmatospirillum siberiense]
MNASTSQLCPHAACGPCPLRGAGGTRGSRECHAAWGGQIVPRGAYLFSQGEDARAVYSVLKGAIALEYIDGSGGIAILRLVRGGGLLGCADLFDGHEYRSSARAVEDTMLCSLPEAGLVKAMDTDGAFALRLVRAAAVESHAFVDFAQRMTSLPVEARVLSLIEELSSGRRNFVLPVSKKDLAFMAGTGPEVLSRTLVKLQRAGSIWMDGNTVTIADPALDGSASRLAS